MITVVSLNPCVDYLLEVPRFAAGGHYRTQSSRMIAAGKGTNVCRALARINAHEGVSSEIRLCGFGDKTLYLPLLLEEGIATDGLIPTEGIRVNVTIADFAAGSETHLKTPGAQITSTQRDAFLRGYEAALKHAVVVVVAGSLPLGLEEDFYARLIRAAKEKAIHTILDASGEAAMRALEAGPTLVKPNTSEFSTYTGKPWDPTAFPDYLRFFSSKNIRYGVVSLGARGAYLFGDHRVIHGAPPEVKRVSSVGAGDVLVAALAVDLAQHGAITEEGFKSGVAFATQSATTALPAHFEYEEGVRLKDSVSITRPLGQEEALDPERQQ